MESDGQRRVRRLSLVPDARCILTRVDSGRADARRSLSRETLDALVSIRSLVVSGSDDALEEINDVFNYLLERLFGRDDGARDPFLDGVDLSDDGSLSRDVYSSSSVSSLPFARSTHSSHACGPRAPPDPSSS